MRIVPSFAVPVVAISIFVSDTFVIVLRIKSVAPKSMNQFSAISESVSIKVFFVISIAMVGSLLFSIITESVVRTGAATLLNTPWMILSWRVLSASTSAKMSALNSLTG